MAFTTPAYLALSRHGIFYFRMSIPARLRASLGGYTYSMRPGLQINWRRNSRGLRDVVSRTSCFPSATKALVNTRRS